MKFEEEVLKNNIVILRPNNPFTWSSGIKSPIYCDNRMILGYPDFREFVINKFIDIVKESYKDVDIIMGTSTAGIPHATLLADKLNLPCGYVRGSAKAHGVGKQIEGCDVKNKKVLVVEDLISTGGSVIEVVNVLKQEGANVMGVVAIFSYELEKGIKALKDNNIKYSTISNIHDLLDYTKNNNLMDIKEINLINKFLKNPNDWLE